MWPIIVGNDCNVFAFRFVVAVIFVVVVRWLAVSFSILSQFNAYFKTSFKKEGNFWCFIVIVILGLGLVSV